MKEIIDTIKTKIDFIDKYFNSPISVMMDLIQLENKIIEYTEKRGNLQDEVELKFILWIDFLEKCNDSIDAKCRPNDKLCVYLIAQVYELLVLIGALSKDDSTKDEAQLNQLGNLIEDNDKLMRTAIFHGFEIDWLLDGNIPEDIAEEYKELKANGYLNPDSPLLRN